jgi:DNA-binding MarR family transcriptional regulator
MLSKQEYVALSDFRFTLSRFLHFSEEASRLAGITLKQYLLLLHIRGTIDRDWATVGELAARLQASAHGTVGLVNRSVDAGLVRKCRNAEDTRCVEVHLTQRGQRVLERIASRHRDELRSLRKVFRVAHVE